jgi:hypothetical protein
MNASEAFETYLNGNISDFKEWLKKAKKPEVIEVTSLWIESGYPINKLKSLSKVI